MFLVMHAQVLSYEANDQAILPWSVQPFRAVWTQQLLLWPGYILGFISMNSTPDVSLRTMLANGAMLANGYAKLMHQFG